MVQPRSFHGRKRQPPPVIDLRRNLGPQIQRQFAFAGVLNRGAQTFLVGRENDGLFSPARNRDIPLVRVRRRTISRIGEQNGIHRLALRSVGGDRITSVEETLCGRESFASSGIVIDHQRTVFIHPVYRNQFTVVQGNAFD